MDKRSRWLMIRQGGRVWATLGRYTFDEAMRSFPSSTPVTELSAGQANDVSAFESLRRNLRHTQQGERR